MKIIFSFLSVFTIRLMAAPPADLTNLNGVGGNRKVIRKNLSEDELTFTGDSQQAAKALGTSKILYSIYGKSLPQRGGKNIIPLKKGEPVQILKESKDKRWWAIQTLAGLRGKAWVPKSAVEKPTKPKTEVESEPET